MAFKDSFDSIVTLSKRNNIYYGPTESRKIASCLEEIAVDFDTLYFELSEIKERVAALSSGYMLPSGCQTFPSGYEYDGNDNLYEIRRELRQYENRIDQHLYVQGDQVQVL